MKRYPKMINAVFALTAVTLTLFEMGCAQAISGSVAKNSSASGSVPPGDAGSPPQTDTNAPDLGMAKEIEAAEETGMSGGPSFTSGLAPAPIAAPVAPNTIHLMTILSDDRKEGEFRIFKMDLKVNIQGDFESAHFYGPIESGHRRIVNGQPRYIEDREVTLNDIHEGKPIQEMVAYGYTHNILQIVGPSFDSVHGGKITLRYLKMGAPHPMMDMHSDYAMRLDRVGNTWTVTKANSKNTLLTEIKMETMWVEKTALGVKNVTP